MARPAQSSRPTPTFTKPAFDVPPPTLPSHEALTHWVINQIPQDQWQHVFAEDYYALAQIGPEFVGFLDHYFALSQLIPSHWSIVDLGCAYAPQSVLFAQHKHYHAVDSATGPRFSTPNTTHYHLTIGEFIATHAQDFDLDETFAICTYCPMWGEKTTEHIRQTFPNLHIYYPHHAAERTGLRRPGAPSA